MMVKGFIPTVFYPIYHDIYLKIKNIVTINVRDFSPIGSYSEVPNN